LPILVKNKGVTQKRGREKRFQCKGKNYTTTERGFKTRQDGRRKGLMISFLKDEKKTGAMCLLEGDKNSKNCGEGLGGVYVCERWYSQTTRKKKVKNAWLYENSKKPTKKITATRENA